MTLMARTIKDIDLTIPVHVAFLFGLKALCRSDVSV
jgi:hypothetical protein